MAGHVLGLDVEVRDLPGNEKSGKLDGSYGKTLRAQNPERDGNLDHWVL